MDLRKYENITFVHSLLGSHLFHVVLGDGEGAGGRRAARVSGGRLGGEGEEAIRSAGAFVERVTTISMRFRVLGC